MSGKKAPSFATEPRQLLPGSEKLAIPVSAGKQATGKLTVSVIVRRRNPLTSEAIGQRLTRAAFNRTYGADLADIRQVHVFARQFGLTVVPGVDEVARRTVQLTGTVPAMQKAFGVQLKAATLNGMTCRVREGSITLPASLAGIVIAVLGLDTRPQAKPHFRVRNGSAAGIRPHAAAGVSYTPVQVAELYQFPTGATAAGQTVGLIELGGGYRTTDITTYFKSLGLTPPTVTAVSVDGGKNSPTNASGADGEVMLDIEVSAAVAPGAKVAVYFAPNTDQGFIDAVSTAVHDTTNKPNVISISWGGPESTWTQQSLTALDQACQSAAALGITITVAAGDNGSSDGVTDGANHVDFPASSPNVLACGGTTLDASGNAITSESVWNDTAANEGATGGGVSTVFPLPTWQANAKVPLAGTFAGRGVPDVAGDADPVTGYSVRVDGQTLVIGGTSAVAPLWAGLIALANAQNKTTAGFLQPTLYTAPAAAAFHDITSGNNGAFTAGPGWDACTGLGSPIGSALISLLGSAAGQAAAKTAAKKSSAKKTPRKNSAKRHRCATE